LPVLVFLLRRDTTAEKIHHARVVFAAVPAIPHFDAAALTLRESRIDADALIDVTLASGEAAEYVVFLLAAGPWDCFHYLGRFACLRLVIDAGH
jgi:hypothetical protein